MLRALQKKKLFVYALRLFSDRLVTSAEQKWTMEMDEEVAKDCFGGTDLNQALHRYYILII